MEDGVQHDNVVANSAEEKKSYFLSGGALAIAACIAGSMVAFRYGGRQGREFENVGRQHWEAARKTAEARAKRQQEFHKSRENFERFQKEREDNWRGLNGEKYSDIPDPYRVLKISPGASRKEIQEAYRKLAKETHPDSGGDAAVEKFHEVKAAYEMLTRANKTA